MKSATTRLDRVLELLDERAATADVTRRPAWTEQQVAGFEQSHGVRLPHGYRELLQHFGPFDDEYGLAISAPRPYRDSEPPGVCPVTREAIDAFGGDLLARARAAVAGGRKLWCSLDDFSTVVDKSLCDPALLSRFEDIASFDAGFVGAGYSVGGDLYLCVAGPVAGTVWADAEYGPIPEIAIVGGVTEPYDFLGWLVTYLERI